MVSDATIERIATIIVLGAIAIAALSIAPLNNEVFIICGAVVAGIAGFTLPSNFCMKNREG